jgi:hypothetical protein
MFVLTLASGAIDSGTGEEEGVPMDHAHLDSADDLDYIVGMD